ncbi:FAD-dependent oxidoreductase [Phycisphaerales bacterium AB-hyl4]|uniref:FAD-dependent oxidoreductase n=1 Tax=Natronomicrosphaera hydrolytica TaxID=3242702 RepID=A0ABV4TZC1_9BACT
MMNKRIFERIYDVVVVGSGMAGFSAATRLHHQGYAVLLIGPRGDLVWEAGRCFCADAGESERAQWRDLHQAVSDRGGVQHGWMDGAITEVVATNQLVEMKMPVLYYAHPVAVEREQASADGPVIGLIVATKAGLRRVVGRRWIDATEDGFMLQRLSRASQRREAKVGRTWMYFQSEQWQNTPLKPTAWPTERYLATEMPLPSDRWEHLREQLVGLDDSARQAVMSHCSVEPLPIYDSVQTRDETLASLNVACASASYSGDPMDTLASRFDLGGRAADAVLSLPEADASSDAIRRPISEIEPEAVIDADVAVVGAGTGGTIAAITAASRGVKTVCLEPHAFAGGIGAGGGIHYYYYGVPGGFQQQLDERVRDFMAAVGKPLYSGAFHPEAKKVVLNQMLREAEVDLRCGSLVYGVECKAGRVVSLLMATTAGPVKVRCKAVVDGTGDGDVAAMAGADFTLGRAVDGQLHAYSQSSGKLREQQRHGVVMQLVNFDAGWCDPTDPEDLTRARVQGIQQYLLDRYDNLERPTYIAPAIGLRQGRQIKTDYILQLDDLIQRRSFEDRIGYTGCHYDNHAVDFEFESDEALFWIWLCRNWRTPMACEISYRMLLPRGLDNVWLASRCVGVSQDAHHAMRMQRDMQRIGEASGYAAALSSQHGLASRAVPLDQLQRQLEASGALTPPEGKEPPIFGKVLDFDSLDDVAVNRQLELALDEMDRGVPGKSMWWLYRNESKIGEQVRQRLDHDDPKVSWIAAGICALWRENRAEPRLIEAIRQREYGYDGSWKSAHAHGLEGFEPLKNLRLVPNWLAAICMLRHCGSSRCVDALRDLAEVPGHALVTRTSLALAIEALASRGEIDAATAQPIFDALRRGPITAERGIPARYNGALAESALRGQSFDTPLPSNPGTDIIWNSTQDYRWQLEFAVARARTALGLEPHAEALALLEDERTPVRHAMRRLVSRSGIDPAMADQR